jgi:hypothetical protein
MDGITRSYALGLKKDAVPKPYHLRVIVPHGEYISDHSSALVLSQVPFYGTQDAGRFIVRPSFDNYVCGTPQIPALELYFVEGNVAFEKVLDDFANHLNSVGHEPFKKPIDLLERLASFVDPIMTSDNPNPLRAAIEEYAQSQTAIGKFIESQRAFRAR